MLDSLAGQTYGISLKYMGCHLFKVSKHVMPTCSENPQKGWNTSLFYPLFLGKKSWYGENPFRSATLLRS